MKKKEEKVFCHSFEKGDLCCNQNNEFHIILEVKEGNYKFMHLQDGYINVIGEPYRVRWEKGDTAEQPCSVFDKYNYLYQHKK